MTPPPVEVTPAHRRIAWWGFGAAAFYSVFVRFFEATGLSVSNTGTLVPEQQLAFRVASYSAGLLILVGGVACLYLALPPVRVIPFGRRRQIPRRLLIPLCLAPVLLGAMFAVGHAFTGMITKTLALLGLMEIPYPDSWLTLDETASAWWDLLFYEPWFLVMGVLLFLAARRYLLDIARHAVVRAVTVGAVIGAIGVTTALTTMIATDTMLIL